MKLKNYTSEVPVERSISYIEHSLIQIGALHISKSIDRESKRTTGIVFQIEQKGIPLLFKLPSKVESVEKIFIKQRKTPPKPADLERIKAQADRTAWKILYDWVEVQCSMILIDRADVVEMFLPYAYDMQNDSTFYEMIRDSGFKQLTQGKSK